MIRKIELMHRLFGVKPDEKCKNCSNMISGRYHDKILHKCTVYGCTHSEASDWRLKYVACGMFNTEYKGSDVIRFRIVDNVPQDVSSQQMEGQISIFEEDKT